MQKETISSCSVDNKSLNVHCLSVITFSTAYCSKDWDTFKHESCERTSDNMSSTILQCSSMSRYNFDGQCIMVVYECVGIFLWECGSEEMTRINQRNAALEAFWVSHSDCYPAQTVWAWSGRSNITHHHATRDRQLVTDVKTREQRD